MVENENILKQARQWDRYAKMAPVLFAILMGGLVIAELIHIQWLFFTAIALFGITAFVWWWWTLGTIIKLVYTLKQAEQGLNQIEGELRQVRELIKPKKRKIKLAVDNTRDKL